MKRVAIILILSIAGLLFSEAPILIPMTDQATYDYIDYLNVSGVINIPFTGMKPYRSDEIFKKLLDIENPDVRTKSFITRFAEEYIDTNNKYGKVESKNTTGWFEPYIIQSQIIQNATNPLIADISQPITDGGIKAKLEYKDYLSLHTNSGVMIKHSLENKLRDEFETLVLTPSGGGEGFQSEDHTETALLISGEDIFFSIGKYPVSMGSGIINTITLSPQKAYYENILFSINGSRIKFSTITGFLLPDGQTLEESYVPEYVYSNGILWEKTDRYSKREKYLSTHRLEWKALDNLNFGINEMVISGDRTIEMGYLFPILPLFWMGHYYGDLDNSLISFDLTYKPIRKISLFGELLFDDETFSESWTKSYQNKWAFHFGIQNTDLFSINGLIFNFEYSRIEPYVYTHKFHINRYMNLDSYLGLPSGPDSEMLNFRLKYFYDFNKNITIGYNRSNTGEPVWGKWDQPNYVIKNKVFLRGTVEKTNYYYADFEYRYNKYLSLNLFYSHTDIINKNHNLQPYNEDWYEDYSTNFDQDALSTDLNSYSSLEDYYEKKIEPYKINQVYSNNTFAIKLNIVLKNYFSKK